jgi:polyhydroxyalkanoate synthesis regulator phasin
VIGDKSFRGMGLNRWVVSHRVAIELPFYRGMAAVLLFLTAAALPALGREKDVLQYGAGLIVNIPLPEPEVAQVVEDVAQNGIIRGTKEYNKDEYIEGAVAATSTPVFAAWAEGGKVFYKVRQQALDPRNFKDSGDVGTLAVRYVVQPQGDKNTVLRIDALFVEDFRRSVHQSSGSVESSEYKDIQDRLAAVELMKKETAEALEAKQKRLAKQNFGLGSDKEVLSTPPATATPESGSSESATGENAKGQAASASASPLSAMPQAPEASEQPDESLEQHVAELRQQVERLVKKPGAPLKSAPFHTASTLKSLEPGAEVLIQIATPYWYGVETRDGQHGWIRRDQLEQVP